MVATLEQGDEVAVRGVLEAWAAAMRAKDAGRALQHQAPGCVHFSLAPPLIATDADTGREGLERWFATWDGPLGFDLHNLVVETGGDIAFAHGLVNLRAASGGEDVDLWFRQTVGLRREGARWRIVHWHESVPFYMDGSFKAAVDLRP